MDSLRKELELLVRARYPLIYLVSAEEKRMNEITLQLARDVKRDLYRWTVTEGFEKISGQPGDQKSPLDFGGQVAEDQSTRKPLGALDYVAGQQGSGVFVLKDFHRFLEDPPVVRRLRDLVLSLRQSAKTILLEGPVLKLPTELERDVRVVDVPLPTGEELSELLQSFLDQLHRDQRFQVQLQEEDLEHMAHAARGLTQDQAWRVFSRTAVDDRVFARDGIDEILAEKKQEIRKSGILEYYDLDEKLGDIGGLQGLKEWLGHRQDAFTDRAREFGLPEPKGVLLLGVQGCGKSLTSKAIAAHLRMPLLRLDVGRIFSSYIGASEENMRQAIRTAESLAPVVLWIDEIEKGFSGTRGGGSADSGATMRVFATFLTWMQEKTDPVFVVATANQIRELPPELLRKGRFDEIFFVDLPTEQERGEIFEIHLRKRGRDPQSFAIDQLAQVSEGFSGAEIEQALVESMYAAFAESRDVGTEDLLKTIERTVPLSQTMKEDIAALREWARTRARSTAG